MTCPACEQDVATRTPIKHVAGCERQACRWCREFKCQGRCDREKLRRLLEVHRRAIRRLCVVGRVLATEAESHLDNVGSRNAVRAAALDLMADVTEAEGLLE